MRGRRDGIRNSIGNSRNIANSCPRNHQTINMANEDVINARIDRNNPERNGNVNRNDSSLNLNALNTNTSNTRSRLLGRTEESTIYYKCKSSEPWKKWNFRSQIATGNTVAAPFVF